jgi:hypothetical protein
MIRIQISGDPSGRIIVSFPYDPLLVLEVKSIEGHRWHPVKKFGIVRSYNRVSTESTGKIKSPLVNFNLKREGDV